MPWRGGGGCPGQRPSMPLQGGGCLPPRAGPGLLLRGPLHTHEVQLLRRPHITTERGWGGNPRDFTCIASPMAPTRAPRCSDPGNTPRLPRPQLDTPARVAIQYRIRCSPPVLTLLWCSGLRGDPLGTPEQSIRTCSALGALQRRDAQAS